MVYAKAAFASILTLPMFAIAVPCLIVGAVAGIAWKSLRAGVSLDWLDTLENWVDEAEGKAWPPKQSNQS